MGPISTPADGHRARTCLVWFVPGEADSVGPDRALAKRRSTVHHASQPPSDRSSSHSQSRRIIHRVQVQREPHTQAAPGAPL